MESKEFYVSKIVREILLVNPLPGYEPEIGRSLWALEDTRRRTKETLAGFPSSLIDWKATPDGSSLGTLLYHVAAIEMDWLYTEILEQSSFPPEVDSLLAYDVRDDQGRLTPVEGFTFESHLQRLDATREIFLTALQPMSLTEFRRLRAFERYEVTPEWVIHHLIQHEAQHRGQIEALHAQYAGQALQVNSTDLTLQQ